MFGQNTVVGKKEETEIMACERLLHGRGCPRGIAVRRLGWIGRTKSKTLYLLKTFP